MTRARRKASARKRRLLPTASVTIRSVKLVEPRDCSRVVLQCMYGWKVLSLGWLDAYTHIYTHKHIYTRSPTHARPPMLRQMKSTERSPSEYSGEVSTRHTAS
jgi:hypothetical protein